MSVMDQWPLQFSSVVDRSEIERRFCLQNNETPFLYTLRVSIAGISSRDHYIIMR